MILEIFGYNKDEVYRGGNMKKIVTLIILLIVTLLLFGISSLIHIEEYSIEGVIIALDDEQITLQTETEKYQFSLVNASYEVGLDQLLQSRVIVSYHKNLKSYPEINMATKLELIALDELASIPEAFRDEGIFQDDYVLAYETLQTLSLEEKVGQMILARLDEDEAIQAIRQYHLSGFVLFKVNFDGKTKEQVQQMIHSYQEASSLPLFMAVDEEGGTVVRISSNPLLAEDRFLSPQEVYRQGGMEAIHQDTIAKATLLKELGLNINLAPVADVSVDPADYIYRRTFGQEASLTADYVKQVVSWYQEENMACTLKHFPGYGNNKDTHQGIAIDEREYSNFLEQDFLPFEAGIEAGVPSILVSHNIVKSMDSTYPASLSKEVHRILREDLGFTGVIMTDDLAMNAISEYTHHPAVEAVLAGNDLIMVTDYQTSYQEILQAVQEEIIPEEMINHAVFRILAWKYQMNLMSLDNE